MKQLKIFEGQNLTSNPDMTKQKKARVVSPGGKAGKKTDENSAKELTKLPAPHPTCPPITASVSFRNAWMNDITMKALNSLVMVRLKTGERGNQLFQEWEASPFNVNFDEWAERYDFKISASIAPDQCTWIEGAERILNRFGNDMSRVEQALLEVWNLEIMKTRTGQDRVDALTLLRFSHSIACQDPTVLFHFDEKDTGDQYGYDGNKFWNEDVWHNPTLLVSHSPLAMIWMSATTLLDHPWIWIETDPNVADYYEELQKKKLRVKESKMKKRMEVRKIAQVRKERARKRDDRSDDEDPEENAEGRSQAPVPPASPNKQGVRFQTREEKEEQEFIENKMDENDAGDVFVDSVQDEVQTDVGQNVASPTGTSSSPTTDKSNLDEYELETGASSTLFSPSLNLGDASLGDASSSFFTPRSDTQDVAEQKIVQLSPMKLSKNKAATNGITPGNNTNEEIEESSEDSDYQNSSDEDDQGSNGIHASDSDNVDDDDDDEFYDSSDDEEEDFDDESVDEDEKDSKSPDSPPKLSRGGAEKLKEMDKEKDVGHSLISTDPLSDIQTTGGVYRRNSLGLLDEQVAQDMEVDQSQQKMQPDPEIQITKVVDPKNSDNMEVDTYATIAAKPAQNHLIPESVKVQNLIQPKIDGLAVPNHQIFSLCFCFMWNGASSGTTIGKKFIAILHAFFTALFQTQFQFKILPLADDCCKNQKQWITNTERTKHLMSHWYQVKNYLDMNYGTADWLTGQSRTTGLKYVRTRIRFAFDDTIAGAMATIGGILEEEGGWVKESPLQRGRIAIIGSLPFLPPMMSPDMVACALMKHFGFLWPIALIWEWVSAPAAVGSSKAKKNQKAPSCQMWRMVTDLEFAPLVDSATRSLCNPKTNRSKLPWCLITTYFHDWRAASKKWLSVGAYGPVRELATTMVVKAIDFNSVTESFCSPTPLPNLLKVVHTTKFGKISLLRLLYSIKATPSQADRAGKEDESEEAGENTQENDGSAVKTDKETEGFVEVINKKGTKATKDEQLRLAAEKASKSDLTDAEKRAELVRQKDAEKMDVLGLFQQIGPVGNGFFFFTSRLKVLQLAQNVINGLPEFLVFHLEEPTKELAEKVAAQWVGQAAIIKMRQESRYWCHDDLCAKRSEAMDTQDRRDESGLDWLGWCMDVTDQVRGYLQIDQDSADCKDIDDGATVAGAADELKEATEMISDLVKDITIKEDQMEVLQKTIEVKDSEVARLHQRIAALEAQAALESQRKTPTKQTKKQRAKSNDVKSSTSKSKHKDTQSESTGKVDKRNGSHAARSRSRRGGGSSAKGP